MYQDAASLTWCGCLLALGFAQFLFEHYLGKDRPSGTGSGGGT